jgi:hypothetical protein
MRFLDRVFRLDSYWSLGQWLWWGFQAATGLSAGAIMAWLLAERDAFMQAYGWPGAFGAGIATWVAVSLGWFLLAVAAHFRSESRRPGDAFITKTELPATPRPPASIPVRHYSAGDKERLSEAFFKLSEVLNKPLKNVVQEGHHVITVWESKKYTDQAAAFIPHLTDRLNVISKESTEAYRALYNELLPEYQHYSAELQAVLQTPVVEVERPILKFHATAARLGEAFLLFQSMQALDEQARDRYLRVVMSDLQTTFLNHMAQLNGWIDESNRRLAAKRKEIADARP